MNILEANRVSYTYQSRYQKVEAVKGVSCAFETGKLYAIVGHSGSGKSTLLSLLAGLDLPTEGEIVVDGKSMASLDRNKYRRETVSMVYQAFHLFPLLTALENVKYPMELRRVPSHEADSKARALIEEVGLAPRIYRQRPQMMSGGEQQRVAIARALASGGKILLADEPTGNLDSENGNNIVALLSDMAHSRGYAVIVVTHDLDVAARADVVYAMKDGRLTVERGE
jgi:putative ABC transport system ATP-binding protein